MRAVVWAAAAVLAAACPARAEPGDALVSDVERIVAAEESGGWFLDSDAEREIYQDVLQSVCRAPQADRDSALAELRERARVAGAARALWLAAGHRTTPEVTRALRAARLL